MVDQQGLVWPVFRSEYLNNYHAPTLWFNELLASFLAYSFMNTKHPDQATSWQGLSHRLGKFDSTWGVNAQSQSGAYLKVHPACRYCTFLRECA
jgi:hypothetical protein